MALGTYEGLKDALRCLPNDDTVLAIDASPFVDFNIEEGGYLSENDDEYKEAFRTYAECSYLEVEDIEDVPELGWGIIHCWNYPFAVPMDAEIDYGYEPL